MTADRGRQTKTRSSRISRSRPPSVSALRSPTRNHPCGTAATYQLQVAETATCGSGTYSAVPTGSTGHWKIVDSANITDGQATTNVNPGLTDEGSTFVPGEEKDAGNTTGSITLDGDEFTEIEFAIQATSNATNGGDYCFRLYNAAGASTLDAYPVYAEVSLESIPVLTQIHYRWRNDDAGETGLYSGTGADGSATISSYKNINTDVIGSNRSTYADGIATTVTTNPQGSAIGVSSANGFAAGDEILLINMQGASGASEYVGNYEFLRIDSVSGTSLYLTSSVQKSLRRRQLRQPEGGGAARAAVDECDDPERRFADGECLGRDQGRHHRFQGHGHGGCAERRHDQRQRARVRGWCRRDNRRRDQRREL